MKIQKAAHFVKKKFAHLKFYTKKRLNLLDPIIIYPYLSYGYNGKLILRGRVLEKERVIHGQEEENPSIGTKIFRLFKRYESDEIPHASLRISFRDKTIESKTDDEGFYNETITYDASQKPKFWEKVTFTLLDNPSEPGQQVTTEGEVMIPGDESDFGIISDVDDTIIQSHALKPIKKIKTLALKTAENRIAFPGVAEFYSALTKGKGEECKNPLWFISGSSWNLYDLLSEFCRLKNIPKAPFCLRTLGITPNNWVKSATIDHKMDEIRPVMDLMDPLPFILIGDSGQQDPEVYKKVVEEYPGRIKAIYIRDVTDDKRDREVHKIRDELKKENIDMILAEESFEAAKHAFEKKWITQEDLDSIQKEVNESKK